MGTLLTIFKALLLITGIIILAYLILSLTLAPIIARIKSKKRFNEIQKIAHEILEDFQKEKDKEKEQEISKSAVTCKKGDAETYTTTTKKPRNTKKKVEN